MAEINCIICNNSCDEELVSYCPDCTGFICDECSSMYEGYCENCYE